MLYLINTLTDNFFRLLNDDPVRPHIPHDQRIGTNKNIFVDHEDEMANAVTCVSYQSHIPEDEQNLFELAQDPNTAIFYTIWSYKAGRGRQLILDSVKYIKDNKPNIERFVTLSPKTDMARRFHLRNGAVIFRENRETINYEYLL